MERVARAGSKCLQLVDSFEVPTSENPARIISRDGRDLFAYIEEGFRREPPPADAVRRRFGTRAQVCELVEDASIKEMMRSVAENPHVCAFSEDQVLSIVELRGEAMRREGAATFIPFVSGKNPKLYVAAVVPHKAGLLVKRLVYQNGSLWNAEFRPRIILRR